MNQQTQQPVNQQPVNPMHLAVALNETEVQLQMMTKRGQQIAVDLYEERTNHGLTKLALEEAAGKIAALEAKLAELAPAPPADAANSQNDGTGEPDAAGAVGHDQS